MSDNESVLLQFGNADDRVKLSGIEFNGGSLTWTRPDDDMWVIMGNPKYELVIRSPSPHVVQIVRRRVADDSN